MSKLTVDLSIFIDMDPLEEYFDSKFKGTKPRMKDDFIQKILTENVTYDVKNGNPFHTSDDVAEIRFSLWLYMTKFGVIPNTYNIGKCKKEETYQFLISEGFKPIVKHNTAVILEKGNVLVHLYVESYVDDETNVEIANSFPTILSITNSIELEKALLKFKIKEKPESNIFVIVQRHDQFVLKELKFKCPKIKTGLHYGKAFEEIDKLIKQKIRKDNGLFIFHGEPGTGKTTYIKHLAHKSNRKFVFVPNSMIDALITPSFITLLMEHQNLVLVLEDAEKVVQSREDSDNSLAATLLNLTDGIIGTACDVAVIVTFNADVEDIDKALLRKGRLKYKYHFANLSIEDSQNLINHLKKDHKADKPMSLADIFMLEDKVGEIKKKEQPRRIGF